MKWRDHYRIGIGHADEQHRHLFVLVTRLQKAVKEKTLTEKLKGILTFLVLYCQKHFHVEEDIMRNDRLSRLPETQRASPGNGWESNRYPYRD